MQIKDQLHRILEFKETPKRIVSLVPSQTELLVDLGLKDAIVGITKFCVHPETLRKEKTIVGGTKQVKLDLIESLKPDIILCNKEENTKMMVEELQQLAPIHISDVYDLESCFELIKMYGELFDVTEKALRLTANIQSERQNFKQTISIQTKKSVVYFIWKDPYMVAGGDTFINYMLQDAGFLNIFSNRKRYPEISLEASELEKADCILLSSEPFPFKEKHVNELKNRFPDKEIRVVDGELFSWYGSRLLKSYPYFKTLP
ncbi:helical backbone metal receptor [Winogradskyella maritima]|uniref:ABC transporter substrate-binding protein n=1 Tax=Winogradskyella maritima TaxID=1517766 RepID=A0ABV8AKQ0_9FLAO|nr:helical backbone metal receptor [Winogradskyella maritima]